MSLIEFHPYLTKTWAHLGLGNETVEALTIHDCETREQDGEHLSYLTMKNHKEGYWTLAVKPTNCTVRYHTRARKPDSQKEWMDRPFHVWTPDKPWSTKLNDIRSKLTERAKSPTVLDATDQAIGDAVSQTIAGMAYNLSDEKTRKLTSLLDLVRHVKRQVWNANVTTGEDFAFRWILSTNPSEAEKIRSVLESPFKSHALSAAAAPQIQRGTVIAANTITQPQVTKAEGSNADGTTADPQEATVVWKQGRREEWLADLKAWEGGKFASAANLEPLANALGTQDTFTWSPEQPDICFSVSPLKIDDSEQVMNMMACKVDTQGKSHLSSVKHPVGPTERTPLRKVIEKWVEAEDRNISQMEKRNKLTTEVYEQSQQQFAFLLRALPHLPQETSMGVAGLPDEDPVFGTGALADALTRTEDALRGVESGLQAAKDKLKDYQDQTDAIVHIVQRVTRLLKEATSMVESSDGEEQESDPDGGTDS